MMRRIAGGGMRLLPLDESERQKLDLRSPMALRVANVGKYGLHATAHKAGVRVDDILIEYDGQSDLIREADVFDHVNEKRRPGDRVQMKFLRNGRERTAEIPIQK